MRRLCAFFKEKHEQPILRRNRRHRNGNENDVWVWVYRPPIQKIHDDDFGSAEWSVSTVNSHCAATRSHSSSSLCLQECCLFDKMPPWDVIYWLCEFIVSLFMVQFLCSINYCIHNSRACVVKMSALRYQNKSKCVRNETGAAAESRNSSQHLGSSHGKKKKQ